MNKKMQNIENIHVEIERKNVKKKENKKESRMSFKKLLKK